MQLYSIAKWKEERNLRKEAFYPKEGGKNFG